MANANIALTHKTETRSQYNAVNIAASNFISQLHCQPNQYIHINTFSKATSLNLIFKRLMAVFTSKRAHALKIN